jgi:hypothetical protein
MEDRRKDLFTTFFRLFHDKDRYNSIKNDTSITAYAKKLLIEDRPTFDINRKEFAVEQFKLVHLFLDRLLLHIVCRKYDIDQKTEGKLVFPTEQELEKYIKKYPDVFTVEIVTALKPICLNLPKLKHISKYAHRYFKEIEMKPGGTLTTIDKVAINVEMRMHFNLVEYQIDGIDTHTLFTELYQNIKNVINII